MLRQIPHLGGNDRKPTSGLTGARGFDRRIGVYLKTLIADLASPDIPIEKTGQMLGEPLFELPSGAGSVRASPWSRSQPPSGRAPSGAVPLGAVPSGAVPSGTPKTPC